MTYDLKYKGEFHRKLQKLIESEKEGSLRNYILYCLLAWEKVHDSGLEWRLEMVVKPKIPTFTVTTGE